MAKYVKTNMQNRNQSFLFILTCEIQIKIYAICVSRCDVK